MNDIAEFLAQQAHLCTLLRAVELLDLPDAWIGAGVIRNAVWNSLHGYPIDSLPGIASADVDVVYFDAGDATAVRDTEITAQLRALIPDVAWEVRNQARMHVRNGDLSYRDVADAIRCWPETATAIAARLRNGRIEILAPHGIDDLVHLIVRPTPAFAHKLDVYRQRLAVKRWHERWPRLRSREA